MKSVLNTRLILSFGLIVVLWSLFVPNDHDGVAVAKVVSTEDQKSKANELRPENGDEDIRLNIDKLNRPKIGSANSDPFASKLLAPASASVKKEDDIPPLPFKYIGKIIEDGNLTIFLSNLDRSYKAKLNDVLDNNYHIDQITDDVVTFTYLPRNVQLVLPIGHGS